MMEEKTFSHYLSAYQYCRAHGLDHGKAIQKVDVHTYVVYPYAK